MGFSSQAGQVILRTQAAKGTLAPDLATKGIGFKLRSGALAPNRDLLIPDPEIGGNRDVGDAYLGPISWSGDYEFYLRPNSFATLLQACLGTPTVTTATGVSTVDYVPSSANALPFLSIEERIGAGLECYNYTDAVVNTLHLECDPAGYAQGTAGLIGAKQVAGATYTPAPVWDASPMVVGTNVVLTYNGVSLPAKSVSLDINNNFADDDFRLGSLYLGDLTPMRREITASFTIREQDSATWRQAVYGTSAGTAPVGGPAVKAPLVITFNCYEEIPAGTPSTPYSVQFTMPNFALSPYAFAVSGADIIDDDISGQALRPDNGTDAVDATIMTGLTEIA